MRRRVHPEPAADPDRILPSNETGSGYRPKLSRVDEHLHETPRNTSGPGELVGSKHFEGSNP